MVRIIYKKGFEGQNKIACIEGIEIDMLNGQYTLIYPKYAYLPMADEENIKEYKELKVSEIDAMKAEDSTGATNKLIALALPQQDSFVSSTLIFTGHTICQHWLLRWRFHASQKTLIS